MRRLGMRQEAHLRENEIFKGEWGDELVFAILAARVARLMPDLATILVFCGVSFVLVATPGPGVLYVVGRSIDQGRRAGIASMIGIESAEVVHVFAVAFGLSALLATSAQALDVLRYGGAVYLIVLGVKRWRDGAEEVEAAAEPASARRILAQGFVVQLLNPKVAIFFLAFFPQFLTATRRSCRRRWRSARSTSRSRRAPNGLRAARLAARRPAQAQRPRAPARRARECADVHRARLCWPRSRASARRPRRADRRHETAEARIAIRSSLHGSAAMTTACSIPRLGSAATALGERVRRLAGVEPRAHGLLDLVVGPADRLAVLGEHLQLAADRRAAVGDVEEVAGIGVARDQPQRLALPHAADQDRRVRAAERLRAVERAARAGSGRPSNGASSPAHICSASCSVSSRRS